MSEERFDREDMEEASAETYGESSVTPSLYKCDECELDVLAANVRWSQDDRALCPRCEQPLDLVASSDEV